MLSMGQFSIAIGYCQSTHITHRALACFDIQFRQCVIVVNTLQISDRHYACIDKMHSSATMLISFNWVTPHRK